MRRAAPSSSLLSLPPDPLAANALARREVFYPKADLPVPDAVLRSLARPDAAALAENGRHARTRLAALLKADDAQVEVRPLEQQGTFHHVFEGGRAGKALDKLVRVNRLAGYFVDYPLAAGAHVQAVLGHHGIPCARVFEYDFSRRHVPTDIEVLERIEGMSLSAFDDDDAATAPHLASLAGLLRKVHAIPGEGAGFVDASVASRLAGVHTGWDQYVFTQLSPHLAALEAARVMTASEASAALGAFERARPGLARVEPRLLHGDPGSHNVIVREGAEPVLVDWEDALLGDPLFDVAFWATFHPERRWPAFFEAYFARGWKPTARFWLYFLRVSISKTVHRLRFGYADAPGRPPAQARIQRALRGLDETRGDAS